MDKTEVLHTVRAWMEYDDEIKALQRQIKEKRLAKKHITKTLVETMKLHDVDCFDVGQGNKLIYTKRKGKKALSKKHLLKALSIYYKGNVLQVAELSKHILDTREDQVKENIRRKASK